MKQRGSFCTQMQWGLCQVNSKNLTRLTPVFTSNYYFSLCVVVHVLASLDHTLSKTLLSVQDQRFQSEQQKQCEFQHREEGGANYRTYAS
eukprot:1009369-Amphidinium_carterae.1